MKTKHILTALALPTMFAACTADDIVSENNGLLQAERAKVSKDFVLNTGNEVDSRYAVENNGAGLNFTYEVGKDLVGANLIDEYTPGEDDMTKWPITNYVAPSLPFKCVGVNEWKSDAELGIGNYLFVYPFNSKDNGRGAAQFELPRVQRYTSATPNSIIAANNKSVGATILKEGQLNADVPMKNLYTYPKFVINFDNGVEVKKVTKVILEHTGDGFVYKGGIHHKAVVEMFNGEEAYVEAALDADATLTKKEASDAYWAQFQTSDFIIDGEVMNGNISLTGNYVDDATAASVTEGSSVLAKFGKPERTKYLIVEMDEAVKANATTQNKSVEVRLMMPSFKSFNSATLKMHVVTDNGTYVVNFPAVLDADGVHDFAFNTDNTAKINAALSRSMSNTLKTVDLTNADKGSDLNNIVSTAADWNKLVEDKKGATQNVAVTIVNDQFSLTKDLNMPKNTLGFTISTPISVEGAVTLKNIDVDNTLTVKKGATLTTGENFKANNVLVEAEGNLVFAQALNNKGEVIIYGASAAEIAAKKGVAGIDAVVNKGTVTVPAGVVAKFALINKNGGVLNVAAAASRAAEADAVAYLSGSNDGKIINDGVINTIGFTNNAPSDAEGGNGYEWNKEDKVWESAPTIENNGTFNAKGTVINYGKFVNNAVLTSNFAGTDSFTNDKAASQTAGKEYVGTLEIGEDATETEIDDNTNGVIILSELKPEGFKVFGEGKNGKIQHTLTDKDGEAELKESPVNYLIATANVDLKNTYLDTTGSTDERKELATLVMLNGGSIKIAATTGTGSDAVKTALVNTLIVMGNSTISGTVNSVTTIKIAKDATLTVPAGARLDIASKNAVAQVAVDSKGALQVNGTLKVNSGLVSSSTTSDKITITTGVVGNSMISFGKEAELLGTKATDNTESVKQGKYDVAVAQWWSDITSNMSWIPTYYNYNPYDTEVIAEVLKVWFGDEACSQHSLAEALFIVWGFADEDGDAEATYTALDAEEKVEAIAAKLTDNSNFTSAIASKVLTLADTETDKALTNLKALFIGENNKKEAILKNITIRRNKETIYESKEDALTENVYKVAARSGEENKEDVAKYVNIWQFKDELAAAFDNTLFKNDANEDVKAIYAYVWKDCDLDKVVAVMAKYKFEDWKSLGLTTQSNIDKFYTLAGVQEFLRLANVKGGTTGAAGVAYTISETYYEASSEWQYSGSQVKLLAGTNYGVEVTIN